MRKAFRINFLLLILSLSLIGQMSRAQQIDARYFENKGLVVVEVESEYTPDQGWTMRTDLPGYYGMAFLEWKGGDHFSKPGEGIMEYNLKIENPGVYHFYWRCKVGKGTDNTEHNDSWLRIPGAADFYAVHPEKGDTVRPHGVCTDDCPKGAGAEGWFKVFSSGTTGWTWTGRTSDHAGNQIMCHFDAPGIYKVQISGRSEHHLLDRFVMFNPDFTSKADALSGSRPESVCQIRDVR